MSKWLAEQHVEDWMTCTTTRSKLPNDFQNNMFNTEWPAKHNMFKTEWLAQQHIQNYGMTVKTTCSILNDLQNVFKTEWLAKTTCSGLIDFQNNMINTEWRTKQHGCHNPTWISAGWPSPYFHLVFSSLNLMSRDLITFCHTQSSQSGVHLFCLNLVSGFKMWI